MIIAVTGFVGVGKTTTAQFIRELGFKVIDVDSLGHELLKDPQVRERLRAEFGLKILDRNLEIDRDKLSALVFSDQKKLEVLNRIIHPHLKAALYKLIQRSTDNVVVDVALFNELNLASLVGKVILVSADVVHIYERLKDRYSKREILNIMNSQSPVKNPDYIIENNGTRDELKRRVEAVVKSLKGF